MLKPRSLFALPLLCLLAACGDGDPAGQESAGATPPAAPPPATAPGEPSATPPAAPPPGAPAPVTVTTYLVADMPEANVDIVFHDASGAVIETTKTDAKGKATSTQGTPSMVTAVYVTAEYRHLFTWTNVEAGDALVGRHPTTPFVVVGQYVALASSAFEGAASYRANVGNCNGPAVATADAPSLVEMTGFCGLTAAGRPASARLRALDGGSNVLGEAFARNVPTLGAEPVLVELGSYKTPFVSTTIVKNLPPGTHSLRFWEIVGSTSFFLRGGTLKSGPIEYDAASSGLDAFQIEGHLTDLDKPYSVVKRLPPTSPNELDLTRTIGEVTKQPLDLGTPGRPRGSWSAKSLDGMSAGRLSMRWVTDSFMHWTIVVPPGQSSVVYPAMPESLNVQTPASLFDVTQDLTFYAFDPPQPAKAVREQAAALPEDGDYGYPLPETGMTLQWAPATVE